MQGERLLAILTEIRDQQKRQLENFERALATQDQALALQQRGKRLIWYMFGLPWLLAAVLAGLLFLDRLG